MRRFQAGLIVAIGITVLAVLLLNWSRDREDRAVGPHRPVRRPPAPLRHEAEGVAGHDDTNRASDARTKEPEAPEAVPAGVSIEGTVATDGEPTEPIGGADVALYGLPTGTLADALDAAPVAGTRTDADGRFTIRLDSPVPWPLVIRATASSYVPRHVEIPPSGATRRVVKIRLGEAARLWGRAVARDGSAIAGTAVWAWKAHGPPPRGPVPPTGLADALDGLRRTKARPDGTFVFRDVEAGVPYRIVATAPAYALRRPFVEARATNSPVELRLARVYLLWARLRDHAEGPIRVDPRIDRPNGDAITVEGLPGGVPLPLNWKADRVQLGEFEVPADARRQGSGTQQVMLWFVHDATVDELGPFTLRVRLPGYEASTFERSADWLGVRESGPSFLPVRAVATAFREVRVRLVPQNPAAGVLRSPRPLARLFWYGEDGPDVQLPIHRTAGTLTLKGVPAGAYRLRVRSSLPGFDIDPAKTTVAPKGAVEPLLVRVPTLHRLSIRFGAHPPRSMTDILAKAAVRVERLEEAGPRLVHRVPITDYAVRGLVVPAGRYRISARPWLNTLQFTSEPARCVVPKTDHVQIEFRNVSTTED